MLKTVFGVLNVCLMPAEMPAEIKKVECNRAFFGGL
jgi:hypothetical protein